MMNDENVAKPPKQTADDARQSFRDGAIDWLRIAIGFGVILLPLIGILGLIITGPVGTTDELLQQILVWVAALWFLAAWALLRRRG